MKLINNPMKYPYAACRALNHQFHSIFGHLHYKRFIVLSRSRTGSNMLISYLNSHPNVYTEGEIFARLNGRDYKRVLKKAFSKQPQYIQAKGFKIFYYHPLDDETNKHKLWADLTNMDNLVVIHLKRRNILRTLISRKIAGIQNVWTMTSSSRKVRTHQTSKKSAAVTFTVDELRRAFKQTRQWERWADAQFREHRPLSVYYEDLVNDLENTFNKITDYLGIEYAQPKTNFIKQNPEGLRNLVINYTELKAAFWETEFQLFFED